MSCGSVYGPKTSTLTHKINTAEELQRFKSVKEAHGKKLADISMLLQPLKCVHKYVAKTNAASRTRAQKIHNACTYMWPLNICVGDYVMIPLRARKRHKLRTKRRGLMRVRKQKLCYFLLWKI